jgi:hypothetical protein
MIGLFLKTLRVSHLNPVLRMYVERDAKSIREFRSETIPCSN